MNPKFNLRDKVYVLIKSEGVDDEKIHTVTAVTIPANSEKKEYHYKLEGVEAVVPESHLIPAPKYTAGTPVCFRGHEGIACITKACLVNNKWHYYTDLSQIPISEELLYPSSLPLKFKAGDFASVSDASSPFHNKVVLLKQWDTVRQAWIVSYNEQCVVIAESDLLPVQKSTRMRFQIGDIVEVVKSIDHRGKIAKIVGIVPSPQFIGCYRLEGIVGTFIDSCLKLYKPKSEMNPENVILGRMTCPKCGMERGTDISPCICGWSPLENNEPFSLAPLLTEFVGHTFYSQSYGVVELHSVDDNKIVVKSLINNKLHSLNTDGSHSVGKCACLLWPSEASYTRYPLNPGMAWAEWKQSLPKYVVRITMDTNEILPRAFAKYRYSSQKEAKEAVDVAIRALQEFEKSKQSE